MSYPGANPVFFRFEVLSSADNTRGLTGFHLSPPSTAPLAPLLHSQLSLEEKEALTIVMGIYAGSFTMDGTICPNLHEVTACGCSHNVRGRRVRSDFLPER